MLYSYRAMSTSPLSPARPRRLSISVKLGGVFLLLAAIASGNLVLSNVLHDSIANTVGLINQSGQLRYLSQKVAFESARFVLEPNEATRQAGLQTEAEFEMRHANVANEIAHLHPLLRSAGDTLDQHLQQVDQIWQRQRAALARVRAQPESAARRAAQRDVVIQARLLLERTDGLVSSLQHATHTANRRMDFIVYLVQALEALFMLGAVFYVRSRITRPIHALTDTARRFAAGLFAAHGD